MIDIDMHMSIIVAIFFQFQIAKDIDLQHNLYWNIDQISAT